MVIKQVSGAAGSGAGGFLGGFFNNPGVIIISAIAILLLFFQGDIRKAFENLGKIDITLPEFPEITLPEFPEITLPEFPELPDFGQIFADLFKMFPGTSGGVLPLPPDVENTGLLTEEQRAACKCGTSIIQDIQGDVSETCLPCDIPEEGDPDFIGPIQPEPPFMLPEIPEPEPPFEEPEPFEPPIELPAGFVGAGPSFEGGTIFERDPCFMTLNEIIEAGLASSASEAANVKAIACSANVTEEPTDFPTEFEFGTSTGMGLLPGETQIVTGEATLESEAKRAACVSCELFGLNCPICAGTI